MNSGVSELQMNFEHFHINAEEGKSLFASENACAPAGEHCA